MQLKLCISTEYNPYKNLAVEKMLVDSVCDNEIVLYLWQNKNTVVIGAGQNPWAECNCTLLQQDGGFVARRLSGGGAVFHDLGNLNFTFICKRKDYELLNNLQVIKNAVSRCGIDCEISGRNDILANGKKFSGNAFYNTKESCYHHGTLLVNTDLQKLKKYLTPSKQKLEAKGIKSVKSRVVNLCELNPDITVEVLKNKLIAAFSEFYGCDIIKLNYNDFADEHLYNKYSSNEYIFNKTAPFTAVLQDIFKWGSITINLNVIKGVIKDVSVFTDSMDFNLAKNLEQCLLDCPYNREDIKNAINDIDVCNDILTLI